MSQYGLVEPALEERGTLVPPVPSDQVRLGVAVTRTASEGPYVGP